MTYSPNPRRAIPLPRELNSAPDACLRCPPYLRDAADDFPCSLCGAPLCQHNDAGYATCATCAQNASIEAARDLREQQADAYDDFWS